MKDRIQTQHGKKTTALSDHQIIILLTVMTTDCDIAVMNPQSWRSLYKRELITFDLYEGVVNISVPHHSHRNDRCPDYEQHMRQVWYLTKLGYHLLGAIMCLSCTIRKQSGGTQFIRRRPNHDEYSISLGWLKRQYWRCPDCRSAGILEDIPALSSVENIE